MTGIQKGRCQDMGNAERSCGTKLNDKEEGMTEVKDVEKKKVYKEYRKMKQMKNKQEERKKIRKKRRGSLQKENQRKSERRLERRAAEEQKKI